MQALKPAIPGFAREALSPTERLTRARVRDHSFACRASCSLLVPLYIVGPPAVPVPCREPDWGFTIVSPCVCSRLAAWIPCLDLHQALLAEFWSTLLCGLGKRPRGCSLSPGTQRSGTQWGLNHSHAPVVVYYPSHVNDSPTPHHQETTPLHPVETPDPGQEHSSTHCSRRACERNYTGRGGGDLMAETNSPTTASTMSLTQGEGVPQPENPRRAPCFSTPTEGPFPRTSQP